jgi:hypothetical protein
MSETAVHLFPNRTWNPHGFLLKAEIGAFAILTGDLEAMYFSGYKAPEVKLEDLNYAIKRKGGIVALALEDATDDNSKELCCGVLRQYRNCIQNRGASPASVRSYGAVANFCAGVYEEFELLKAKYERSWQERHSPAKVREDRADVWIKRQGGKA